jgi:hypothetical protein
MSLPRTGPAWALVALLVVAAPLGARAGAAAGFLPPVTEWRLGGRSAPMLAPHARAAPPVRLQIPAIGVDARVAPVDLGRDGALVVPMPDEVGWYRRTPPPGDRGSAVVTGHVDSAHAPGVFARLGELTRGDRLGVAGEDGWTTVFEVRAVTRHAKAALPASLWRHDDRRILRLITCGGRFDRARRSYTDNVIVHAIALGRRRSADGRFVP